MSTMNIENILDLLPHRYPFLLVDRVLECDDEKRIVGLKNLTINEPFFQGHFPGEPIMPAVLQLESMAQVAGLLMNKLTGNEGKVSYFTAVKDAKFRRMAVPGDQLRIEIEVLRCRLKMSKIKGQIFVGEDLVSEATLMFTMGSE